MLKKKGRSKIIPNYVLSCVKFAFHIIIINNYMNIKQKCLKYSCRTCGFINLEENNEING